jgi:predicted transposase/invertase (TIGR01784 family)
MKFVDPKTDIAFKKIFGNDAHKSILIEFLNEILVLEYPIASLDILNPYQSPKLYDLKSTSLDIRAKDKADREFIVEMQVAKETWFSQRALYYSSKAYSQQLSIGGNYQDLKPVIFLGILNFSAFSHESHLSRHLFLNSETKQHDLKDLEFNFVELTKFKKSEHQLETIADKWIYFIQQAIKLDHVPESANTPALKLAYEIAAQHKWSRAELEIYEVQEMELCRIQNVLQTARMEGLEQGLAEGLAEGIEKGIEQGIAQGIETGIEKGIEQGIEQGITQGKLAEKQAIAKGMLAKNLDLKIIVELTGLTMQAVIELQRND